MTTLLTNLVHTPFVHDNTPTPLSFPFSIPDSSGWGLSVRGRFHHSGEVFVRGADIAGFCATITAPGLHPIARQVHKIFIDFDHVRPTQSELELVSAALAGIINCTDLTLLGLPSAEYDGWVLRNASFSLHRFETNLSLTSKDVLDFLRCQPALTEVSTTSPPPYAVQPKSTYQHVSFPTDIVPHLHTLDCPAPFLMSLQAATPPTRPLTNMRLDLNRLNSLVEVETLTALSTFSATMQRLSLRRSVLRTSTASDSVVALNMASVITSVAKKRQWSKLKFLEMRDGIYSSASIPSLAQSISTCFPHIETLVWAPSSHPSGSTIVVPFIASIFFTFCRSLRQLIFLDDATDATDKKYVSVEKKSGGQVCQEPIKAEEVEDMWRAEST